MRQRNVGLLFVVLGAALFGTLGIFGKAATTVELSMATLLGIRFVAATAILWGLLALSGRTTLLGGRVLVIEVGIGVVYGVMSITYFESLTWLSAGIAALLLFTYPVQVTIASAFALEEPLTAAKLLALAAAVAGVGLVVVGDGIEVALAGVALVAVSSVCYTIYAMGTRVMVADVDPLVHTGHLFLGVTATILVYGVATTSLAVPATPASWSLIAGITVVGTLVPIVLFTEGLTRIEASTASIVSTSEPLTTVLLGAVLLGESLTPTIGLGAVLILSAVVLTTAAAERVIGLHVQRLGSHVRTLADI